MGLPKGRTNNPKGREVGSKNRVTGKVRDSFKKLLEDNICKMQEDLNLLHPRDRLRVLLDLAKFVVPTLQATTITDDSRDVSKFEDRIKKLAENDK